MTASASRCPAGGRTPPLRHGERLSPGGGIRRLLCGTQPILSLRALKAALDALDGIDVAAIRAKSLALTDFFMDLVEPICREFGARIITPATMAAAARWRSPTSRPIP